MIFDYFGWLCDGYIGEQPVYSPGLYFLKRVCVSVCLAVSSASGVDSLLYFSGSPFLQQTSLQLW